MATTPFYASGLNADPGWLAICRGQLQDFRPVLRNGVNFDLDAGASESLWELGTLYVFPPSASVMQLSSSSASDAAAGVGARTVLVLGLDANYSIISETVILNGQTQVATVAQFLRVHSVTVLTAGSSNGCVGTLYVGTGAAVAGVPPNVYAVALPGWNTSNMIAYTVPAGYTAYLINSFASAMGSATNQNTKLSIRRRAFGSSIFLRSGSVIVGGQACDISGSLYARFSEKTDLDAVMETTDTNVVVAGQVRLLLVPGNDNPT